TSARPAGGFAPVRSGSIWALSPTSTTLRSGLAAAAATAPGTPGAGPLSPPIASPPSRMALLPFCLLPPLDDFPPLVVPAVRADPVRQDRLVAPRAVLNPQCLHVVVAPPLALNGFRRASLGNGHGRLGSLCRKAVLGKADRIGEGVDSATEATAVDQL